MSRVQLLVLAAVALLAATTVFALSSRLQSATGAPTEAAASALDAAGAAPDAESVVSAPPASPAVGETGQQAAQIPAQGPDPRDIDVTVEIITSDLDNVVGMKAPPDGSGRLFLVEKKGTIRIWENGALADEPFLDVSDRVEGSNSPNDERGLLGLAFHPNWVETGEFFINYTGRGPGGLNDITSRFQTGDDGMGDPDSEEIVITYRDPAGNHNGGDLAFGPDGYLYIASGDGGGANDQFGNGQNKESLLAKILRLDVDSERPYAVPPDNPFVGEPNAAPEAWAWGLRNPWRFSFDRATGDLYIADVGQNTYEEVNFAPADSPGGENYGWSIMEASSCFQGGNCDRRGLVLPVAEYRHSEGCSVTGGYVYRGSRYAGAQGLYLYSDWCTRTIWGLSRDDAGRWRSERVGAATHGVASFGEDQNGELYIMGASSFGRINFDLPTSTPGPSPTATPTATQFDATEPPPDTPETPATPSTPTTPTTPDTPEPTAATPTPTSTPTRAATATIAPPPAPAYLPHLMAGARL